MISLCLLVDVCPIVSLFSGQLLRWC